MRQMMSRGLLICIEGLDRSGKTTLCNRMLAALNPEADEATRAKRYLKFPERQSAVGKVIDSYLQKNVEMSDEAIHLLFSANRWENQQKILDQLSAGHSVILDRYAYSGVAYSVLKGFNYDWCRSPDRGLPKPDCVVFLYAEAEALRKRSGFGAERYERTEIQLEARRVFLEKLCDPNWFVLDTSNLDSDAVFQRVNAMLDERFGTARPIRLDEPVGKLWDDMGQTSV